MSSRGSAHQTFWLTSYTRHAVISLAELRDLASPSYLTFVYAIPRARTSSVSDLRHPLSVVRTVSTASESSIARLHSSLLHRHIYPSSLLSPALPYVKWLLLLVSRVHKMVIAAEDPTLRMLRSGFGKQVASPMGTSSSWGFGTAHRDNTAKLYLSPEQTKTLAGNNSQGPVYKTYEALGPQPESKFSSAPSTGFGSSGRSINYATPVPGPGSYVQEGAMGTMKNSRRNTESRAVFGNATRDQMAKVWLDDTMMKVNFGKETPGPCQYTKPVGIGKQSESQYVSVPAYKQGTSRRFNEKSPTRDVPGAGTYQSAYAAVGKQTLSTKASLPSPKIGTGSRDAGRKMFISKDHEKSSYGEASPGPASGGKPVDSIGPQLSSSKQSSPAFGFGTSKRDKGYGTESPGPGTYWA